MTEPDVSEPDVSEQMPAGQRECSTCGESCPVDANFCEACGTDLAAPAAPPKLPCVSCAADSVEITDDGWCQICGTKQPAPEDHVVADHGWFAMVSDKGQVHRTNEDSAAIAARASGVALVVCDGVSSTDESQNASQNAVLSVIAALESASADKVQEALIAGAAAAQHEIIAVTKAGTAEPPSCTLVAAVADTNGDQASIQVGWLGDSRAYWIAAGEAVELTTDHSWAMEQLELGELEPDVIESDSRASSITRWLGADSHDVVPELLRLTVDLPGRLLVCSDGLWNYAKTPQEMHDLVESGGADETPLERAERLVAFANDQGGHDNITVALAELTISSPPGPSPTIQHADPLEA